MRMRWETGGQPAQLMKLRRRFLRHGAEQSRHGMSGGRKTERRLNERFDIDLTGSRRDGGRNGVQERLRHRMAHLRGSGSVSGSVKVRESVDGMLHHAKRLDHRNKVPRLKLVDPFLHRCHDGVH